MAQTEAAETDLTSLPALVSLAAAPIVPQSLHPSPAFKCIYGQEQIFYGNFKVMENDTQTILSVNKERAGGVCFVSLLWFPVFYFH